VRHLLLSLFLALFVVACGSSPPSPTPSPSPSVDTTVTTPDQAWAAVVAAEPRFAKLGPKDPDLIGQAGWYEVRPASGVGAFVVAVTMGWGDCEAGCIDRHTWTLAVMPDGTVRVLAEDGPAVPPGTLPGADITTGVMVITTSGPTCPVEQTPPDPACAARPVPGARIVLKDDAGTMLATGLTGFLGVLELATGPGSYTVEASPVEGYMGTPSPTAVVVTDGSLAPVELVYDTGIR
jgi:hypothetical protein